MPTPYEMVLKKLRAAHAVIADCEWIVQQFVKSAPSAHAAAPIVEPTQPQTDATNTASERPGAPVPPPQPSSPLPAPESEFHHERTMQPDLFSAGKSASKPQSRVSVPPVQNSARPVRHKPGTPQVDRRQATANFRTIAGSREVLDLADVNRIFGYNQSTSGTFVRHAIKRGELMTISYGTSRKFLARDVRAFIKLWFDSVEISQPHTDNHS